MIQINFKAKHCYWVASLLINIQAGEMAPILAAMAKATQGVEDDEQTVTVPITLAEFERIYPILAGMPEGLAALINDEMETMLTEQAMQHTTDDDWLALAAFVQGQDQMRAGELAAKIADGKSFLTAISER